MNIIYIFSSASQRESSVQNKVLNQIKYLNIAGANCRGVFFSNETILGDNYLNEQIEFIKISESTKKYFSRIDQRKILDLKILDYVRKNFKYTDIFYIRYPGATKDFYNLVKEFGTKIVTEHQSKELDEIKSLFNQNPFRLSPSKILSWYQYSFLPYYRERVYGSKIVKRLKAIVAVTNEIAIYQKNKGCKNVFVVTNGINTNLYPLRNCIQIKDELNLLYLKGTSGYSPWNGFDRLIVALDEYYAKNPHGFKIKLWVYGHKFEGEVPIREYIHEKGFISGDELNQVFDKVHIGVSGIQVYLKNFKEGTSLKVREYIARGLPFFYAYTDPDLNEESKEFALEFPNDESLIDMKKVIAFAKKALEDNDLPQKMRKYAENYLDYEIKMKQLFLHLERLNK